MSDNEKVLESPLASQPIKKIMMTMGIPMIISMMLQALYNIVDSAFVGNMGTEIINGVETNMGELAMNALTLAFPVQTLMIAFGVGTGVGVNALTARLLGQGDREQASRTAGNGVFLAIVMFVVFLLFGIFGVDFYVKTQTENPEVITMCVSYLRICCCVSAGVVLFPAFEKLLQATGRSLYSTIAQIAGALTNIVLDPILIFGWLGLPKMGVVGAALATVLGQIVSAALAFIFHLKKNKEISNGLKYLKPSGKIIGQIYSIGFPAIIAQALMSVMTYGMNLILVQISENVVTAYGLYYKIQQFILFAAFGLRDAITPIVSFNYGMASKPRIKDGIKYGMMYTLIIMVAGTVILEVLAGPLAAVFGLTSETQELCIGAIRIVSIAFVFAGANIALQGVFQALNSGISSLIVSLGRQLVFVLPVAWLLSLPAASGDTDKTWLVWLTFIIAEVVTAVIAVILMSKINKKKVAVLPD